jgi:hypothetical protein
MKTGKWHLEPGKCSQYTDSNMGWTVRVWVQVGANDSSLLQNLQPGSGANLPSNGYGTEGLSWGVNQQGCKVNHSLLSAFEDKNDWRHMFTAPVCLYGVNSNKFAFTWLCFNHKEPCRKQELHIYLWTENKNTVKLVFYHPVQHLSNSLIIVTANNHKGLWKKCFLVEWYHNYPMNICLHDSFKEF